MNYPCIKIYLFDSSSTNLSPNLIPYQQFYYIIYMLDKNIYAVSFKTNRWLIFPL